jgi:pimeloyl-ACP methyl ester carboxylesterase
MSAAEQRPARSEFVTLRGRRYHVRVWGDDAAPAFFFLHGWCDVAASFQFVVDALRSDWKVIAPDWRGFGHSQWNEGPYWFPDYVADLEALLDHYSPEAPARIVGHSMGGNVTGLFGGARPQRIARFVNLEGFGLWVSGATEAPDRLGKWLDQMADPSIGFRRYATREEFAARLRHENPRLTPERAEFLAAHSVHEVEGGVMFAGDPRHRWINPSLVRVEDAKACWRRIDAPTLWVAAEDSFIMKGFAERGDVEEYRERLACYANAREVLIPDCGHNLHHDRPEIVAGLIDEFFA